MNRKGGSSLASKPLFYASFLILFTIAVTYSLHFVESREIIRVDFNQLEDSVVINRVISCLSGDNFGEIDINKFSETELRNCLVNSDFNFKIELTGMSNIRIGDMDLIDESRIDRRYVLVDGEKKELKVRYFKDASQ